MKNNMHLVPQIVLDCAESLANSKHENARLAYTMRLEAIRDYCDSVLKKTNNTNMFDQLHNRKVNESKRKSR